MINQNDKYDYSDKYDMSYFFAYTSIFDNGNHYGQPNF
ncbi:hypothetical protein Niako_6933 [Niastella koreensis GR20-10]|uniref:Uncharacterized protein n=1 Tax=Niastella koreensis (strain DSM 17620 / KACC 11465 / NBRC 106392 / GR20-10) TaxID=700598 RepID=G8TP37_NIAKG|nr:hypothetical protein Niako_6933 [Niastella koreensis GR20-10]